MHNNSFCWLKILKAEIWSVIWETSLVFIEFRCITCRIAVVFFEKGLVGSKVQKFYLILSDITFSENKIIS